MGFEMWLNVLAGITALATVGILVAGVLLLRAMVGVRGWNIYLAAIAVTMLGVMWAAARMHRLAEVSGEYWEKTSRLSDEMEVYLSVYLNGPLVCLAVIFTGGLLLYLLGKTAAQERLAGAAV
ncbi:hypothetical protein [Arthrobacter psychrolactophilus]|nr:hypothetical protein [Arthrobacter psychrolactophilus]